MRSRPRPATAALSKIVVDPKWNAGANRLWFDVGASGRMLFRLRSSIKRPPCILVIAASLRSFERRFAFRRGQAYRARISRVRARCPRTASFRRPTSRPRSAQSRSERRAFRKRPACGARGSRTLFAANGNGSFADAFAQRRSRALPRGPPAIRAPASETRRETGNPQGQVADRRRTRRRSSTPPDRGAIVDLRRPRGAHSGVGNPATWRSFPVRSETGRRAATDLGRERRR